MKCPHCKSSTAAEDERCQWCSKPIGYMPRAPLPEEMIRRPGAAGSASESKYRPGSAAYPVKHGELVEEMEQFALRYNMSGSRFSRLCTNNTDIYLYDRVVNGGNPRACTVEKIKLFMDKYRSADLF